jgi:hypothetical protein
MSLKKHDFWVPIIFAAVAILYLFFLFLIVAPAWFVLLPLSLIERVRVWVTRQPT